MPRCNSCGCHTAILAPTGCGHSISPSESISAAEFPSAKRLRLLARRIAGEGPVVSASALTSLETIAIGHGTLQDTLIGVAGADSYRPKAVAGANPLTVRASHWRGHLGNGRLKPALYHVFQQIRHAMAVAPFVVVPTHQFEEAIVQLDAGALIVDRRRRAMDEIRAHDLVFRVIQQAFKVSFAGFFHRR